MNSKPHSAIFFGLDLGLRRDPTALAVLEDVTRATGEFDFVHYRDVTETVLILRAVETLPLETPYADLPEILAGRLRRLPTCAARHLVVDCTGAGLPVLENLRAARLAVTLHPIVITGGQEPGSLAHAQSVPRRVLLENLRAVLETGRLRIPATLRRLDLLYNDCQNLGHPESSGPDDLAFAVALAVWKARPQLAPVHPQQPLPGTPGRDPRQGGSTRK